MAASNTWQEIETSEAFSVCHEAGFIEFEDKGYLIGDRGIKAVAYIYFNKQDGKKMLLPVLIPLKYQLKMTYTT
ncbi:MAG: hypothetical protein ACSHW0_13995 [Thalassotalea sp.]